MKRIIALLLSCCLLLVGCKNNLIEPIITSTEDTEQTTVQISESVETEETTHEPEENEVSFNGLSDPDLCQYLKDDIYYELVNALNSEKYFVENVQTQYISKEYIEELTYNSQENVFFGYSLSTLYEALGDTKFVFTLGDDGQTDIIPFEKYDDTYERVIKNVAIGTGVILICVTVSIATSGAAAPGAVSTISTVFAASAKGAASMAVSGAVFSGVVDGLITGFETNDFEAAKKAALLSASEGFKWGAITGAVVGGGTEIYSLKGATLNGLSINEAAFIQKESKLPLSFIKNFHSVEEYAIYKDAALTLEKVNGSFALIQNIDLNQLDEFGRTNLQRMLEGLAPLDKNGISYELHHIGQKVDSPLAILSKPEHIQGGNYSILHFSEGGGVHAELGTLWNQEREEFWIAFAQGLAA